MLRSIRLFSTFKIPHHLKITARPLSDTVLPHEVAELEEKELETISIPLRVSKRPVAVKDEQWWRDQLASGEKWESKTYNVEKDRWG